MGESGRPTCAAREEEGDTMRSGERISSSSVHINQLERPRLGLQCCTYRPRIVPHSRLGASESHFRRPCFQLRVQDIAEVRALAMHFLSSLCSLDVCRVSVVVVTMDGRQEAWKAG